MSAATAEKRQHSTGKARLLKSAILIKPLGSAPVADSVDAIKRDAEMLTKRLQAISPKPSVEEVPIDAAPEIAEVIRQLCEVNAELKALEAQKAALTADLKTAIGDASELRSVYGRYCAEPVAASVAVKSAGVRYALRQ